MSKHNNPSSMKEAADYLNGIFGHTLYEFAHRAETETAVERISISFRKIGSPMWELAGIWESVPAYISNLDITSSVVVGFQGVAFYLNKDVPQIQFMTTL